MEFRGRTPLLPPADHIAYQVLDHNEAHGTSFVPWYGGDSAPEDWDGGLVLWREGRSSLGAANWRVGQGTDSPKGSDIIGYTVLVDVTKAPTDEHQKDLLLMNERQDTVTIRRMTEADHKRLYPHLDLNTLKDLRLIKPEPTREERFFNEVQTGRGNYSPEVLSVIQKALEFER